MRQRVCDFCRKKIQDGKDYYKICRQVHKDKKQMLIHSADMCDDCFNKRSAEEYI